MNHSAFVGYHYGGRTEHPDDMLHHPINETVSFASAPAEGSPLLTEDTGAADCTVQAVARGTTFSSLAFADTEPDGFWNRAIYTVF